MLLSQEEGSHQERPSSETPIVKVTLVYSVEKYVTTHHATTNTLTNIGAVKISTDASERVRRVIAQKFWRGNDGREALVRLMR